jgi:hypothetical protein
MTAAGVLGCLLVRYWRWLSYGPRAIAVKAAWAVIDRLDP